MVFLFAALKMKIQFFIYIFICGSIASCGIQRSQEDLKRNNWNVAIVNNIVNTQMAGKDSILIVGEDSLCVVIYKNKTVMYGKINAGCHEGKWNKLDSNLQTEFVYVYEKCNLRLIQKMINGKLHSIYYRQVTF